MPNDPDPKRGPGRSSTCAPSAFALTDRSHTLESACTAFGDPYEKPDLQLQPPERKDCSTTPSTTSATPAFSTETASPNSRATTASSSNQTGSTHPPPSEPSTWRHSACARPLAKFTSLSARELGWDEPNAKQTAIPQDEPRGDLDPALLGYA